MIALAGVALSAFVSVLISRKSTYINSVTAERAKWIANLRNNISEYSGTLAYVAYKLHHDNAEYVVSSAAEDVLKRMEILETTIKLQLNPNAKIDANIIALLDSISFLVEGGPSAPKYAKADQLLVRHTQWLLKEEWEKVKYEARGPIRQLCGWPRRYWRSRGYAKFSSGSGSIKFLSERE
jgi:hypothetical protein